jgi:hypothetical protein
VIDPVGEQSKAELPPEAGKDVQKRHRVGAPAHRDEDAISPRDELIVADGARAEGGQRRRVRAGH